MPKILTEDKVNPLLLAFKPRQVLLAMPSMNSKSDDCSDKAQVLSAEQKTHLLQLIAAFLEINGFSKTLKKFLSEAKIEKDALKDSLLDLEQLYHKNIIKCNHSNTNLRSQKVQDLQTDVLSQGNEVSDMVAATENVSKKKKKQNNVASSNAFVNQAGKNLKETAVDKEGQDLKLKSKEKKKAQKISNSLDQGVEKCEDLKEPEAKESDKNCKDKKKKKGKSDSNFPPDTIEQKKSDSLPVADLVKTTGDITEKETKCKDMKKKDKKANSLIDYADTFGFENKQGADENIQTDDTALKSKSKKKKKHGLASESLCGMTSKEHDTGVTNVTGSEISDFKSADPDGMDKESIGSKKKKRLASEEKDSQHADNKSSTQESKCRKVDGLNESKGSDKQADENAVTSHDSGANNDKGESDNVGSIDQNANIDKSADKSSTQKSMKKQRNVSVELKTFEAFKRVKVEEVEFIDERLKDNSYWAKDGADTGYGAKAQEVLGQVRGRDFRHEKTKKKRGSYRGGNIDLESHSVKFSYSDDE